MKIACYIRGSTEAQQNTLEAQKQSLARYCEARGYAPHYFSDSGVSGSSTFMDRPAVRELIATGITHIAFTKLDRAFRSVRDCILTIDEWTRRGIAFHIIDQQIDTSTAMGRAFLQIMAVLAELENGQRAERQRINFQVMRTAGHRTGTVPYGWLAIPSTRVSKTGRNADDLIPHQEEQSILRQILRMTAEGETDCTIARTLNRQGTRAKRGGKWFHSSIASIREHARLAEHQAA